MKDERLIKCKFLDTDNKEYELSEIKGKKYLENAYSMFHVMARPLVKIINESEDAYVLFDYFNKRNATFKIVNLNKEIIDKAKEFNITI